MQKLLLVASTLTVLSILSSCGQSANSNSFDDLLANIQIDPSNTNLVQAYQVINNRCISCHTGYHNSWASYNTDQKWLSSGMVSAGSTGDSPLIQALKNSGGTMPLNGANLTESEYNKLTDWIDNL